MAIRALVEQIIISECGDKGSFKANVEAFQTAGYLSRVQREFLDAVLEAGHAAIHRNYEPSNDDLTTALDMAENLVELLYVHKDKVKQLKTRIPPRKKG